MRFENSVTVTAVSETNESYSRGPIDKERRSFSIHQLHQYMPFIIAINICIHHCDQCMHSSLTSVYAIHHCDQYIRFIIDTVYTIHQQQLFEKHQKPKNKETR